MLSAPIEIVIKPLFADTSALIAIGNRRDAFPIQAVRARNELRQSMRRLMTTNAVLLEFGNAFSKLGLIPVAVKMIQAVRDSRRWRCVNVDATLTERGFQKRMALG